MITVQNRTPYAVHVAEGVAPATTDPTDPAPRVGQVQVVVKATFQLVRGEDAAPAPGSRGTLVLRGSVAEPAATQQAIVIASGATPAGYVEGDLCPAKDGADLVILGSAYPHKPGAVRELQVQLRIGDWQRVLQITGDRAWKKKLFGWAATDPAPFTEMPIAYDRAFGGTVKLVDGTEQSFAANPCGKGWLPAVKGPNRDGAPLPNVEALGALVESPDDAPEPAGFAWYPLAWSLRRNRSQEPREDGTLSTARLWNAAHPSLILPAYPIGQRLRLQSMTPEGPVDFAVPRLPATLVHNLGATQEQLPASPDTLCLWPAQRTLFVLARWLLPCPDGTDGREISILPG